MTRRRRLMMLRQSGSGGESPYQHGTWDDLCWQIDHGSVATAYQTGETLPLDLGSEHGGAVGAQIVGFNADPLTAGGGNAAVSMLIENLLPDAYSPWGESPYRYDTSGLKTHIDGMLQHIPAAVAARIAQVTKYYRTSTGAEIDVPCYLWAPSARNLFGSEATSVEEAGPVYSGVTMVKHTVGSTTARNWWTGSWLSSANIRIVRNTGAGYSRGATSTTEWVAFGFAMN